MLQREAVEQCKDALYVSSLKPDQIEGIVTKFSEATNCDRSALLQSLTAVVTEFQVAEGVSLPTIQAKVGLTGYDTIAYRKFVAQNDVQVNGVVRLNEVYEDPADVLKDEAVKFYDRNGIQIPVEMVPTEQLTADRIAALGSDGTLHVLIAPEVTGTEEAVDAMRTAVDEVDQLGVTMAGKAIGLLPTSLMGFVDSALQRIETYKNPGFFDFAWLDDLFGKDGRLNTLDTSMQLDFDAGKVAELSTYVAEVVAAIQQGEEVKAEDIENLQTILTLISELDTLGIGGNVIQGIAQGMTEGGWDSDAETVVVSTTFPAMLRLSQARWRVHSTQRCKQRFPNQRSARTAAQEKPSAAGLRSPSALASWSTTSHQWPRRQRAVSVPPLAASWTLPCSPSMALIRWAAWPPP